jgi:hypothetical protein
MGLNNLQGGSTDERVDCGVLSGNTALTLQSKRRENLLAEY